jgi:hypothetical protein
MNSDEPASHAHAAACVTLAVRALATAANELMDLGASAAAGVLAEEAEPPRAPGRGSSASWRRWRRELSSDDELVDGFYPHSTSRYDRTRLTNARSVTRRSAGGRDICPSGRGVPSGLNGARFLGPFEDFICRCFAVVTSMPSVDLPESSPYSLTAVDSYLAQRKLAQTATRQRGAS